MKKIILLTAIAVSTFSCKPKHDDPAPIISDPVADSIHFDNIKLTGDTISTYKVMDFASLSASLTVFQNNQLLPNESVEVFFKAIDKQGIFKINAIPFTSKFIKSNDVLNFDFYPTASKGVQRIELSCTVNSKIFRDTLSFFVKNYQPIIVNFSSKYFLNQAATSNVNFSFEVKNGSSENSIYRYKTTPILSSTGHYAGTTLLYNSNTGGQYLNSFYSFETNTLQKFSLELTNNLPGRYSLPIQIWDSNFLIETDTIVYEVK